MLAKGSTVCCAAFDPSLFWSVVERIGPTWYYASPTMHNLILNSAPPTYESRFRLICNAAGGLLPSLALQLQEVFSCTVLPSYGMTECMPISTPPLTYKLDRTGTSGVATGPELAILAGNEHLEPNAVGNICVRGEPVSHGYLKDNGVIDKSAFNEDGWFDTGDMGYMDSDGYLYITGRSKEVINRGGEIISPFEVENAIVGAGKDPESAIFGQAKEALAFSVKHDVLQEIVGVVLVSPRDKPRPDLRALQEALKETLQKAKWPAVIVYMDNVPKGNNKVLRIRLAERLSLPTYTDDTPFLERHWEAICPPDNTALSVKIEGRQCEVDEGFIAANIKRCLPDPDAFDMHMRRNDTQGTLEVVAAPTQGTVDPAQTKGELEGILAPQMVEKLDNYLIPHRLHVLPGALPRLAGNPAVVDVPATEAILADLQKQGDAALQGSIEGRVISKFAEILQCDASQVRPDADFFELGGDSLRAGKLIAALRAEFAVAVPIGMVFNDGTPDAIARFIEENLPEDDSEAGEKRPTGCTETYSSTRWWLMLLQLFPMAFVYPLRRGFQWTLFMAALTFTHTWPTRYHVLGRLFGLVLSITFARFVARLVMPWVGILAKWIIIGRYKEGLYPMWGSYHTRWWQVQKIVDICGYGWFGWSNWTRVLYFRLMGAKIGKNVSIARVRMGEWDLIEIHDGAVLENCTCRPFGAEWNTTMYLGKIVIGRNSTVGTASIVAPGTEVPENTCIGPNSSSWELSAASESNRDLLSGKRPKAHWALSVFVTFPLVLLRWFVSLGPWIGGLIGLVIQAPKDSANPFFSIIAWFAGPRRVGFHYLALVLRAGFTPFIGFAFAVIVKWILDAMFGKLGPSPARGRSQIATWRMDLMRTLMSAGRLHDMTEMFGTHYEATSVAVRALGGKIGKRVYWPGTGPAVHDWHLINIGDDVVFGSRSHMITSDAAGAEPIVIGKNTMIADRVCLLPGVEIGEGTTMGSGAMTQRNKYYNTGGTYVGSKDGDALCLNAGVKPFTPAPPLPTTSAFASRATTPRPFTPLSEKWDSGATTPTRPLNPMTMETAKDNPFSANASTVDLGETKETSSEDETTSSSPFGRAFYYGQAPYHVLGPYAIFAYSFLLTVLSQFYWNVPSISSIQITNIIVKHWFLDEKKAMFGVWHWYDPFVLWGWMTVFISILTMAQTIAATAFVIASKWALLGRRRPGNYDWDKSSYCQRWQIFLGIERFRRACYRGHGILGMLTSTHWIVLYFKAMGAQIGQDCALFANGDPSLYFTEPDLLTLGDRVAVDDASLVGHINTRGKFDLNRLSVGDRCVLRSGSRLLSGANMESDACLMEHTLVMGGDVVNQGETMQGWPAGVFRGKKVKEELMRL